MKVKKLCTLMTIFALMAIFSIIGVQAEGKVAKIGETGYETFEAAVAAATEGQTVELTANAEFSGGVTIDKSITIDGGGYTLNDVGENSACNHSIKITAGDVKVQNIIITRTNSKSYGFFWIAGGTKRSLTFSDNVTMKNVKGSNGAAVFVESNYGTLNVTGENVKFEDCSAAGFGVIGLANNAKAVINNIEIISTTSSAGNGIGVFDNGNLTMTAGTISGYGKAGIGVANSSGNRWFATVNAGEKVEIKSCNYGIEVGGPSKVDTAATISDCTTPVKISHMGAEGKTPGTINIKGGTITGTGYVIVVEDGTVNIEGGEINGNDNVVRVSKGTVNITGGTVNVANSAAINAAGGTVNITGGTVKGNTNLVYTNDTKAVVNVKGGSIESTGVSINADNGTVNISGGKVNAKGTAIFMAGNAGTVVEINGGTVTGNKTLNGIRLEKGTVNLKNGTINDFEYGIRVLGGTLNVSGGTIESCKFGIGAEKGTVSMTGGTIRNCKSTTGTPGMGIYVNKTDALNVNVSGGTITGCDSGLNIADNNEATLAGDVTVTGNTGSNIWVPGAGKLYISGKFNGTIRIKTSNRDKGMTENVIPASDFEGIRDLSCITNDYDQSFFGYCNMETKTFGWTKHPEVAITSTDSGVYENDKGATLGAIRFITEFQAVPTDAIEYIGTYVLNAETVNTSAIPVDTKFVKFESDELTKLSADSKNAYAVDVINIEDINFGKPVIGISFVKLKGIDTPRYATAVVKNVNIDKNLGISDGTNFAAQE